MKFFSKLSLVILCLIPLQVLSHSKLMSSEPANQAELSTAPEQTILNFNRKVRLMKLELLNAAQESLAIDFKPSPEKSDTFTIELPALSAGTYQTKWMAMSGDSHKIKGGFTFAVLPREAGAKSSAEVVYSCE